jgi:hypothetical protein
VAAQTQAAELFTKQMLKRKPNKTKIPTHARATELGLIVEIWTTIGGVTQHENLLLLSKSRILSFSIQRLKSDEDKLTIVLN